MGQLDRLSALDASFLNQERDASPMQIGGVVVFDSARPGLDEFIALLDSRLSGRVRYRQRLVFGRLGPRWVDDDSFDLRYHVRAAALPSPAGDAELGAFVAQIASERLDRSRPLWQAWLVEAGPKRFALVFKHHRAMIDGVSHVDLATVVLDREAGGGAAGLGLSSTGGPPLHSAPTRADLLLADARDAVDTGLGLAGRALGAALRPDRTVREAVEVSRGVGELAWAVLNPAPDTPLAVELGAHRRYAVVHQDLAEYKTVRDTFGGTVNDVVLTVVSGALRRWLLSRDVDINGLELRALVPISVRREDGAELSMIRVALPVYMHDPVASLHLVREALRDVKASHGAVGASALASVADVAPPAVLAQASRLVFSPRLFNLTVTNIPGPQTPLYLLGHRASALYPLPCLAEHHGLAVAVVSYDGQIEYGLLGDYAALGDLDLIAEGIESTLTELVAAAAAAAAVRTARSGRESGRATAPAAKPAKRTRPKPKTKPAAEPDAPQSPADIPLMGSTTRRRSGPGSDMRAKRRSS